jgi:hypothetical protein
MSKGLQWVIGIGVVLVVVAVVFSSVAPFFLPRAAVSGAPQFTVPNRIFGPRLPFLPGFLFRPGRLGPRMPFFSLFGLAGCIWPLLLAGLIVLAMLALTRRPVAPPPVAQPAAPPAPVSQAVCSNCGQPLQPGWRHCPNCGTAVGSNS